MRNTACAFASTNVRIPPPAQPMCAAAALPEIMPREASRRKRSGRERDDDEAPSRTSISPGPRTYGIRCPLPTRARPGCRCAWTNVIRICARVYTVYLLFPGCAAQVNEMFLFAPSYLRWFLLLSRLAFYLYRAYWSRPFPIDDLAPARCAHCGGMVWNGAMHLHRSPRRSGCERPRRRKRNRHVHVHVRHRDSGAARTVLSRD